MNAIKTLDPREELEAVDEYNPDDGDCSNCYGEGCSACTCRRQFMQRRLAYLRLAERFEHYV